MGRILRCLISRPIGLHAKLEREAECVSMGGRGPLVRPVMPIGCLVAFLGDFFKARFFAVFFVEAFFETAWVINRKSAVTPDFFKAC